MNDLAKDIVKHYDKIKQDNVKNFKTPGYPGWNLCKNEGKIIELDEYRILVGKLIYYTTKISLDW